MAITKDMSLDEIVREHPESIRVFLSHGLMCIGCPAARFENLEQGAVVHGIDVETLIKDLNEVVTEPVES